MPNDPLEPKLSSFTVSVEENAAVNFALTLDKPWAHDKPEMVTVREIIKTFKERIRDFHLRRQSGQCCYCRTMLHGTGSFMVDREHILPKKNYKNLTYSISNLSVACKRCNMEIKKDEVGFIRSVGTILANHEDQSQYYFIHPNYERYSDFITRTQVQLGDECVIKYVYDENCEKASFTYNYFNLSSLEIDSFNETQGVTRTETEEVIKLRLQAEILRLQRQLSSLNGGEGHVGN